MLVMIFVLTSRDGYLARGMPSSLHYFGIFVPLTIMFVEVSFDSCLILPRSKWIISDFDRLSPAELIKSM
jgi:hypothetical protein